MENPRTCLRFLDLSGVVKKEKVVRILMAGRMLLGTFLMAFGGSVLVGRGISQVLMSDFRFVGSLGIAEILLDKFGISPG